jgi:hypothetical protein
MRPFQTATSGSQEFYIVVRSNLVAVCLPGPGRTARAITRLAANNDDGSDWLRDDHLIVTIVVTGNDLGKYFDIGDRFALWLGSDIASGVVSRRLFM